MLREAVGDGRLPVVEEALDREASVSVRLNPSKSSGVRLPILDGSSTVPWCREGYILKERPVFTLHPLFHSGVYYVQDSSSMFVGYVFRRILEDIPHPGRPLRVLDLCAAPGGKTTDLAASLRASFGDGFILVANEVVRSRASVLAENVARWGDPNVVVTSADPKAFAALEGFFDIILADVPCSGEGMFRKDAEALSQWSADNVALCEARQRRIAADVWPALSHGGTFIYSTCTFNLMEDDGNAGWICGNLGAESVGVDYTGAEGPLKTDRGWLLAPGLVPGEGQYCSALRKTSAAGSVRLSRPEAADSGLAFCTSFFDIDVICRRKGELAVSAPRSIAAEIRTVSDAVGLLSSGCATGVIKGRDFIPDEDLALCTALRRGSFPEAAVDKPTALAFLHRDPIMLPDSPRGTVMLSYKNVPLGFVRNLGNRTNSLHPVGRRIRMDI